MWLCVGDSPYVSLYDPMCRWPDLGSVTNYVYPLILSLPFVLQYLEKNKMLLYGYLLPVTGPFLMRKQEFLDRGTGRTEFKIVGNRIRSRRSCRWLDQVNCIFGMPPSRLSPCTYICRAQWLPCCLNMHFGRKTGLLQKGFPDCYFCARWLYSDFRSWGPAYLKTICENSMRLTVQFVFEALWSAGLGFPTDVTNRNYVHTSVIRSEDELELQIWRAMTLQGCDIKFLEPA